MSQTENSIETENQQTPPPETGDDNGIEQQRAIPSLKKKAKKDKGNDKLFWGAMAVLVLIAAFVLFSGGEADEEPKKLTDKKDKTYPIQSVKLDIPKNVPDFAIQKPEEKTEDKPVSAPVVTQPTPKENAIAPDTPQPPPPKKLTAEERQRLNDEKQLKSKQLRAPILTFSNPNAANALDYQDEYKRSQDKLRKNREAIERQIQALQNGGLSSQMDAQESGNTVSSQLTANPVNKAKASFIKRDDQRFMIAQGKVINAVLETAIHSELAGYVRAVIDEDVYSFDGRLKLIEKGARLIGQYQSGTREGQTRIFITWNRILTRNGVDININSPSIDQLGRSGVTGWVDNHFLERFGASIFLSILGAYTANEVAGGDSESEQNVRESIANEFNNSANIALENSIKIQPTIHKNQGDYVKIFVAQDINFKDAYLMNMRDM